MSAAFRLADRSIVVTGAASGIGQAIAVRVAAEGAAVTCVDMADCTATLELMAGRAHRIVRGNVAVRETWDEVLAATGAITGLVGCAGVLAQDDDALDLAEEEFDRIFRVNAKGAWLGMRAVLPEMITRGTGSIVNIGSLAAQKGVAHLFAYGASKNALAAMTRQVAVAHGKDGIRANTICPGAIVTPLQQESQRRRVAAGATSGREADAALGRVGQPHEVAAAACFLLSDDGSYLTGQEINVDGGWSSR